MLQTEGRARSQLTRARIIEATVACLVQGGFSNTTMRAVAAGAGTSVGAVQYHFPTKQDLLIETLTEIFQEVVLRLGELGKVAGGEQDRARRIVRTLWSFYQGERFLAASEILLGTRMEPQATRPVLRARDALIRAYRTSWDQVIGDTPLAPSARFALLQFIISTLRGLGLLAGQVRDEPFYEEQLAILEGMVAGVLASGHLPGSRPSDQERELPTRRLAVV